jgi:hypothetical protein
MQRQIFSLSLTLFVMTGCASKIPKNELETIHGRIKDKYEVAAQSKHSVNESHTQGTFGVAGLLIAKLMGTPSYLSYQVQTESGRMVQIASKDSFDLNTCVLISAPKGLLDNPYTGLSSATMETSSDCGVPPSK